MIDIKNASILDILPYTFTTDECRAAAIAIQRMCSEFYNRFSALLFWGDIEHTTPVVLDAMAAELDAPFYTTDMPVEQKRSMIAAAFRYNSHIGTVSSIENLLAAAFGGGKVVEWFEYSGVPYHFKLTVESSPPLSITKAGYELVKKKLDSVKPKRAKLDEMIITRNADNSIYIGVEYVKTYKRFIVPAAQVPDEERGFK
ncbi:MAG: phage tail protein [Candidatus Ornithomonoglobus sp.]